jgi:hypothetical protein
MGRMKYGLIGVFIAMTAVATSLVVLKCLTCIGDGLSLGMWIALQSIHLALVAVAFSNRRKSLADNHVAPLVLSSTAAIVPLGTLVLFLLVFVIGHSSNVAQIAGESGYGLWHLWFTVWPLLLLGNVVAGLVAIVATIFPPYPPRHWVSVAARFLAVLLVTFAWYFVGTYFPDA